MCFQTSACRGIAPSEEVKGHEGRDNGLCGGGGRVGGGGVRCLQYFLLCEYCCAELLNRFI